MALHTLVIVELLVLWIGAALVTTAFTRPGERLRLAALTLVWPVSLLAAAAVRLVQTLRGARP